MHPTHSRGGNRRNRRTTGAKAYLPIGRIKFMDFYTNVIRHNNTHIVDDLIEILQDLFQIYSPSYREQAVMEYAAEFLKRECGFTVTTDAKYNILAVRGTPKNGFYPLLNAHGDTVQDDLDEFLTHNIRYDAEKNIIHGRELFMLGCDDKAGMAIIMTIAKHSTAPLKILFTVEEESGCGGITAVDPNFFKDVAFAITLDRKGAGDIITEYGGRRMAPKIFTDAVVNIGMTIGHPLRVSYGSFADTYHISTHCIAINLSTGYYNAHSQRDYVNITEAMKIAEIVSRCIIDEYSQLEKIAVDYEVPPLQPRSYRSTYHNIGPNIWAGNTHITTQSTLFQPTQSGGGGEEEEDEIDWEYERMLQKWDEFKDMEYR
jgi:hypothetical protein